MLDKRLTLNAKSKGNIVRMATEGIGITVVETFCFEGLTEDLADGLVD